jgi:ribosomal protein S18 acetylase RimI-like enzyme
VIRAFPDAEVERAAHETEAQVGHDPLYMTLIADLTTLSCRCRFALGADRALAARYLDLPFAAVSFYGRGEGLRKVLRSLLAPGELCYALVGDEQFQHLQSVAAVQHVDLEWQMAYRGDVTTLSSGDAFALGDADWLEMAALAERGGMLAFEHNALEKGPYSGVRRDQRLVAMAGTHLVLDWMAEIGNVVTDPAYRRRGLGSMAVAATTRTLVADNLLVVLQVLKSNTGAIAFYRALGFECSNTMYLVRFVVGR